MGLQYFDEKTPIVGIQVVASGSGTSEVLVLSSYVLGPCRLDQLWVASGCATDKIMTLVVCGDVSNGGSFKDIASFTVPAGAGDGTVPLFDALTACFVANQGGIAVPPNWGFAVKMPEALTGGDTLTVTALGGDL